MAAAEHGAVVLLGVSRQPRVLLREKVLVFGELAVTRRVLSSAVAQVGELLDDVVFAGFGDAGGDGIPVGMGVPVEMIEARIAIACATGGVGIDLVEVGNH